MWLDASDSSTITDSSGAVSQWDDKSGNNRHVLELSTAQDPITGTKTINDLNVIDFVSNDVLQTSATATWLNSTKFHFIAVLDHDASGMYAGTSTGSGSNKTLHIGQNGSSWYHGHFSNDGSVSHSLDATPMLAINSFNNTGIEIFKNGTSLGTHSSPSSSLSTDGKFSIGRPTTIGNLGSYDGTIAEVICITGDLSTEDRQKIEGYLAHKWGLESNLPAGHPYKNSAP